MNTPSLVSEEVRSGSFRPVVECCYARTLEHFSMTPHFHNRAEIMYVQKGHATVYLYDSITNAQNVGMTRQRKVDLRPGEFVILDCGAPHALEVRDTSTVLNVEFRLHEDRDCLLSIGELAKRCPEFLSLLSQDDLRLQSSDPFGYVLHALEHIIQEFSVSVSLNQTFVDVLMANLLLSIAKACCTVSAAGNAYGYVQKTLSYISAHLASELRICDIAEAVNISPAYLQRIFKQTTGATLVEYINRQRVDYSKSLLLCTDDAIVDVAIAAGFNSRQHFFRVFTSLMNISPAKFRQKYKSKSNSPSMIVNNADNCTYFTQQGECRIM